MQNEKKIPADAKVKKRTRPFKDGFLLVAGAGLERCDLRVMSPTSYQLLHPASRYAHI